MARILGDVAIACFAGGKGLSGHESRLFVRRQAMFLADVAQYLLRSAGNHMSADWFEDRVAVVTGGASGIGCAVVKKLWQFGAKVAVVDRDETLLDELSSALGDERAIFIRCDVSDLNQIEDYVGQTVTKFGTIDFFHNNAGIIGARKPMGEWTPDDFRKIFEVNVMGLLLGMQAVARVMLDNGGGSIVNTGSAAGHRSALHQAVYGASKAAVHRLSQHAATEWGPSGVRVNAIAPGPVDTPAYRAMFSSPDRDVREAERLAVEQGGRRPIGRASTPDEVADLVLWLLGPQSATVTGAVYRIDGGVTA